MRRQPPDLHFQLSTNGLSSDSKLVRLKRYETRETRWHRCKTSKWSFVNFILVYQTAQLMHHYVKLNCDQRDYASILTTFSMLLFEKSAFFVLWSSLYFCYLRWFFLICSKYQIRSILIEAMLVEKKKCAMHSMSMCVIAQKPF